MATLRDIKLKIKSIKNTQKITRAMKLVSTAKLKQAVQRVNATKPFTQKLRDIVVHLSKTEANSDPISHPYFKVSKNIQRVALFIVAGDRGLCGSFNSDIYKRATPLIKKFLGEGKSVELYLFGKKGNDFFRKKFDLPIREALVNLSNKPDLASLQSVIFKAAHKFSEGYFQEIHLVYTQFISTLVNRPTHQLVLPASIEKIQTGEKAETISGDFVFEPDSKTILKKLLPRYIEMSLFQAIIEAAACEHASRMIAMGSATDKAGEMIDGLTQVYNRARQSAITTQLIEIVSGADALES